MYVYRREVRFRTTEKRPLTIWAVSENDFETVFRTDPKAWKSFKRRSRKFIVSILSNDWSWSR